MIAPSGAGLAAGSFAEVPLNDSAAAAEDTKGHLELAATPRISSVASFLDLCAHPFVPRWFRDILPKPHAAKNVQPAQQFYHTAPPVIHETEHTQAQPPDVDSEESEEYFQPELQVAEYVHSDVEAHVLFWTRLRQTLSPLDCSLGGAGLAEASLCKVLLPDSAAAGEDKKQTSLARLLSLLVFPEHKDVETPVVLTDTSKQNLAAFDCSFDGAVLEEASLSEVPLQDSAAAGEDKKQKSLPGSCQCLSFQSTRMLRHMRF